MSAHANVWKTGRTWAVHARHDITGDWITEYGFRTEQEAIWRGDALVSQLNAEAQAGALRGTDR